jgi:hypothetical protein
MYEAIIDAVVLDQLPVECRSINKKHYRWNHAIGLPNPNPVPTLHSLHQCINLYRQRNLTSSPFCAYQDKESSVSIEHLQEFAKIYLANRVFCQLLKGYAM